MQWPCGILRLLKMPRKQPHALTRTPIRAFLIVSRHSSGIRAVEAPGLWCVSRKFGYRLGLQAKELVEQEADGSWVEVRLAGASRIPAGAAASNRNLHL